MMSLVLRMSLLVAIALAGAVSIAACGPSLTGMEPPQARTYVIPDFEALDLEAVLSSGELRLDRYDNSIFIAEYGPIPRSVLEYGDGCFIFFYRQVAPDQFAAVIMYRSSDPQPTPDDIENAFSALEDVILELPGARQVTAQEFLSPSDSHSD
ncbi:MAG: hypothetical protein NXI12_13175 [Alphaproteobacteria bacterium]|nr:hypothetical protein [Alphaproteobacteria bacterium]